MLVIEVVSRADLSRVLESRLIDNHSGTLLDVIKSECSAYNEEFTPYLSAFVDGVRFPYSDWDIISAKNAKKIKIVIEAGGIEASTVMAIISIVLAVGTAVYSILAMNKMSSKTAKETKQGSSIYDVNAQGNQVNLNNVIPENFGYFKRFPDYLADKHIFYRNNTQFVDMILCQGVGSYQYQNDHSDIYVGETPINELDGCSVAIYEPGETMTAENSIEENSWYCYYSSTQVTQSGHTLKGTKSEVDQSSQINPKVNFLNKTFFGQYSTVTSTGGVGCAGPYGDTVYQIHKLDLNWEIGAYFSISGSNGTRLVGSTDVDTIEPDALDPTLTTVTADISANFSNNENLHKSWLRPHRTELDPDENPVIVAGDSVRVLVKKKTKITYTLQGGTSGPRVYTDEATAQVVSLCELMAVDYVPASDSEQIIITVPTAELDSGSYPDAPATPGGAYNVSTSQEIEIVLLQPLPADYPYSDNGLYIIEAHDQSTGIYTVSRVNSSYGIISDWAEFWAQGTEQTGLSFTLDEASASMAGESVGPYRACPVGATATKFEYDIKFPQGLGYLQDDGTFRDLTIQIEIGYRRAGSNDPWITETKTFTNHTNDELAYTYTLEVETAGNYEFKMKNLTEEIDSTRALQECKWIGLKSVISEKNKYDDVTVIIGRFKGTETLSELSSNQIATYWTRKLPTIADPEVVSATRELAPVINHICNNSKYAGIVDVVSLAAFNTFWNSKNIKLDGTLDSSSTLLDVLRDCLNVGFSAPVIRNNKLAFVRLHQQGENEPLAQVFSPQNLTKSTEITFNLPRDDETQEIVTEYISPETYKTETLFCSLDENGNKVISSYPNSDKQEKLKAFGVTVQAQAEAMGMRRLRYIKNTRITYEIETELDGLNCQYNDLVGLFLDENLSNITGRITSADGLKVYTDMEIPEALGTGVIYIRRKNGTPKDYIYTRNGPHELTLDTALTWDPEYGSVIEYPFFAIGEMVKCWVTEVIPQDKRVKLKLINYNEDIFTDDL